MLKLCPHSLQEESDSASVGYDGFTVDQFVQFVVSRGGVPHETVYNYLIEHDPHALEFEVMIACVPASCRRCVSSCTQLYIVNACVWDLRNCEENLNGGVVQRTTILCQSPRARPCTPARCRSLVYLHTSFAAREYFPRMM